MIHVHILYIFFLRRHNVYIHTTATTTVPLDRTAPQFSSLQSSGTPSTTPTQVYNIRSCPTPGQYHLFCLPGMNNTLTWRQRNPTVCYQIVVDIKNIYYIYTFAYYIIYDEYICAIYARANSDKQGASSFLKMINVLKLFGQINLSRETEINEN